MVRLSLNAIITTAFSVIIFVVGQIVILHSQTEYSNPLESSNLSGFICNLPFDIQMESEPKSVALFSTATVLPDGLNLRYMPDANNDPLKILHKGSEVMVISVNERGWTKVVDDTGIEGYMDNDFLQY